VLVDGAWQCPYTEPLLEGLPHSRVVIEQGFQGMHHHPNRTRGLKYVEWAMNLGSARVVLRRGPSSGFEKRDRLELAERLLRLERAFGIEIPIDSVVAFAKQALRRELGLGAAYRRLLDRIRPKALIVVVHYSHRLFPIVRAARERGIPTIELQHGVIGPEHLPYNMAKQARPLTLPDHLLLFGEYWRTLCPRLPFTDECVHAIGYGHFERCSRPRFRASDTKPRRVLFLSQPSIGRELGEWAALVSSRLSRAECQIVYRLHPSERAGWRTKYPALAAANVEVVAGGDLYEQFATCDAQVGVYSTAVFEGVASGLDTLVAGLSGHEGVLGLVDAGAARLARDTDELVELLNAPMAPAPAVAQSVFRPGAVANFAGFLQDLLC
jgi:hypothetical protein